MFQYTESFETIREAQLSLLDDILHSGELVEDTIEINNVAMTVAHPLKNSEEILTSLTDTGEKFCNMLLLQSDPTINETYHGRIHSWKELVEDKSMSIMTQHYDQVEEIIKKLKEKSETKRAVISLWKPSDISGKDPFCGCWTFAQFLIRNNRLISTAYYRSCDIYNMFNLDILGVAKLQLNIALSLGIKSGEINIVIGSAHVYNKNIEVVRRLFEDI